MNHPFDLPHPGGSITDKALEDEVRNSLLSGDVDECFVGIARAVHWGFFSSGGRGRIQKVWDRRSERDGFPPKLSQAAQHAENGQLGLAIGCLHKLPQLGGVAFGSKVIAFLNPALAGVYDNKVNDFMRALPSMKSDSVIRRWLEPHVPLFVAGKPLGRVNTMSAQNRYQEWCLFLKESAFAMNTKGNLWGENQTWRAIDVERAIFAYATANP
jgi:hypothetical protein